MNPISQPVPVLASRLVKKLHSLTESPMSREPRESTKPFRRWFKLHTPAAGWDHPFAYSSTESRRALWLRPRPDMPEQGKVRQETVAGSRSSARPVSIQSSEVRSNSRNRRCSGMSHGAPICSAVPMERQGQVSQVRVANRASSLNDQETPRCWPAGPALPLRKHAHCGGGCGRRAVRQNINFPRITNNNQQQEQTVTTSS